MVGEEMEEEDNGGGGGGVGPEAIWSNSPENHLRRMTNCREI